MKMRSGNDRALARKFYFHHIPKTAGTTLRNHLILHLGADRVAPMIRGMSLFDVLREYGNFDAITGHVTSIAGDHLPRDRFCITLLRDPFDRLLSAFFFTRTVHTSGVRAGAAASQTFDDWVFSRSESEGDSLNAHIEWLWPLGWKDQYIPPLGERLQAAKTALDRFDLVGIQHLLDESIAMLDFRTGWPPPESLPVDNATPARPAASDISRQTRARVLELLAPDIELFEYAQTRFAMQRRSTLIGAARMHSIVLASRVDFAASSAEHAVVPDQSVAEPTDEGSECRIRGTGEIRIGAVTVSGDVSGPDFAQVGEWVTIRLELESEIEEAGLTAGFSIRDHAGALVFGTNTLLLGHKLAVQPGRFAVSFRFPNVLGMGRYAVSAAVHRGPSHLDGCFHWFEPACSFEVVDSVAREFQGRVRLHVEAVVESLTESSRFTFRDANDSAGQNALALGRRNAALRDFRAELRALGGLEEVRRGADGLMTLAVTNSGEETWGAYGRQPVHISHHWLAGDGSIVMFDGLRTSLPYDLPPGQSLRLDCFFRAPDIAGEAELVWTLVQEEVAWFDDRDPRSRLALNARVVS